MELLLGREAVAQLHRSFVVIVGLGAVGGFAAEALARSGIGKIRVVDYDVVQPSNINRQILALWNTVGRKKCDIAKERILAIHPDCHVEILDTFVHKDTLTSVLEGNPDVVLDAIDSLNPKIELIAELIVRGQTAVSSMGAALRQDPTKIRVGPLTEVSYCPLAAAIRKRLRRRDIEPTIPCVYSCEPVRETCSEMIAPPDGCDIHQDRRGRHRNTLGSLPTLTGMFGLIAAHTAIQMITKTKE